MTYPIGQRIQVGKLFYQVSEAQWVSELEGSKQLPKNRILQLHLSVTNSGGQDTAIPFLRLLDAKGNAFTEVSEIDQNSRWLGVLRRLQPSLPEDGWIYFDVPVGAYKLEVVDNADPNDERVALVDIPVSMAPPPVTVDSSGRSGH